MTDSAGKGSNGSERTRIRRNAQRAEYDPEQIKAVLDANQICHVAYVADGEPRIIPTLYMRRGDHIYLHGNRQAAVLRHLAAGGTACISVMCVDGVVVARSGFHCSMNYRSVVLFGEGELVGESLHEEILDGFVETLIPGHGQAVRPANAQELAATTAVRFPINEASAKIRTGPAIDDEKDLESDVWAGVIPIHPGVSAPVPNPDLKPGIEAPDYILRYRPPA
jgi:nitroimidazol reductase NimA-like FMN-containing flavoprotein (pyridoxamine 5'-phosphate oxidase superfamily)